MFLVVHLFYHMLPSYGKFLFLQLLFSHVLNLPLIFVQDSKRRNWHCAVSQGLVDFAQVQNEWFSLSTCRFTVQEIVMKYRASETAPLDSGFSRAL